MSIIAFFFGSIAFAIFVPAAMKRAHVRRQNRLLGRCRALYVLAVQAIELANEATARSYLARIRRLETRWRFGNRKSFRVAFAFWAIGVGVVGFTILRALSFVTFDARLPVQEELRRFADAMPLFLILGCLGSVHALSSYFSTWADEWLVDDCGDRLEQILKSERFVSIASETNNDQPLYRDGLTPREVFGLGPTFTRRQLDLARRRLVIKLHPDLWPNAASPFRRAREEALKRVNAAYDQLRASAG